MSLRILLDTSFLVAQVDAQDVHHAQARKLHRRLVANNAAYIYLDLVINEAVTVLSRRARERGGDPVAVIRVVRERFPAHMLDWAGPELPSLWEHVLNLMERYGGRLSFIDCALILIAQQGRIDGIASFDSGFDLVEGMRRYGR